jgi:RNA polymerase sigma factor (sigma-70 family)
VLAVDEALEKLAERHPRQAHVVELRYYTGLTTEEIAEVLGVSVATVKRDWEDARQWLERVLNTPSS